jgi:hypothetical protein
LRNAPRNVVASQETVRPISATDVKWADRGESQRTIVTLWDDGYDFALISYMEWEEAGRPIDYTKSFISVEPRDRPDRADPWHGVQHADQLAEAIHDAALGKYPESGYAKQYGRKLFDG